MNVHELKTWPGPFGAVWDGRKTFEVRVNDRDFKRGDHLDLREWDPTTKEYSGRRIEAQITYIGAFVYPGNYVGMQIDVFRREG